MVHDISQFLENPEKNIKALNNLKEKKLSTKIGVSIYNDTDIEKVLKYFIPDVVQFPINIFDQSILSSKKIKYMKELGIETHARSIFLQGVLLMEKKKRNTIFSKWNNIWKDWEKWLEQNNITNLEACLSFVSSIKSIDKFVIGVNSLDQLKLIEKTRISKNIDFSFWDKKLPKKLIKPNLWIR